MHDLVFPQINITMRLSSKQYNLIKLSNWTNRYGKSSIAVTAV